MIAQSGLGTLLSRSIVLSIGRRQMASAKDSLLNTSGGVFLRLVNGQAEGFLTGLRAVTLMSEPDLNNSKGICGLSLVHSLGSGLLITQIFTVTR